MQSYAISRKQVAQLAIDIIDLIEEFGDNPDVLENVDVITVTLNDMFGRDDIDWVAIGSDCDDAAYRMRRGDTSAAIKKGDMDLYRHRANTIIEIETAHERGVGL